MSYTLNHSNGQLLTTVVDGTINVTSTSLTLVGKDYAGYGQFLNENFIYLLENFANTVSPAHPTAGQLWWDTTNNILRVYSGTTWKISTGATSAPFATPPGDLSALGGDLWFDTTNNQLKVYSGSSWITIGPVASTAVGNSGAVPTIMVDTGLASHVVIQFLISGVVYAIFSKDTFACNTLAGFTNIIAGINFSSTAIPSWGLSNQSIPATASTLVQRDTNGGISTNNITATNITAQSLSTAGTISGSFTGNLIGNVSATNITSLSLTASGITASGGFTGTLLSASQPNVTTLGILNGLQVGTTSTGPGAKVTNLWGTAYYNGTELATIGGSASFSSINGTPVGNATPSTGRFTTLTATGATNLVGVTVTGAFAPNISANASITLGQTNAWWSNIYSVNYSGSNYFGTIFNGYTYNGTTYYGNTYNGTTYNGTTYNGTTYNGTTFGGPGAIFYGTAVTATYADLAERYESDAVYPAGTIVELGGTKEITQASTDLSEAVFGVISTNAAYLMNQAAGTNDTHPAIALVGRVPVRVIGRVLKGDRLVSAGNGVARAGLRTEITAFNVIGRALHDKFTSNEELVEAVIRLNI
ncbi:MAG TPA: hypothetical protein VFM18_19040 [Methanosarcina sp.]|nr:hypothetical protein [Methanosarcina sp.]